MNQPLPTTLSAEDLAWQADLLLLAAQSPAEQTEFAELLGISQAAREALAEEVLLLAALGQLSASDFPLGEPITVASRSRGVPSQSSAAVWFTWIASGLMAASLLLAATLASQFGIDSANSSADLTAQNSGKLKELASLWSQDLALYSSPTSDLGSLDLELEPRFPSDDESSEIAPDWMFAAVAAELSSHADTEEPEGLQWQ